MTRTRSVTRLLSLLASASLLVPTTHAQLVVTTVADEDDGDALPGNGEGTSLREAVKYANPGETVTFAPALSGQMLSVTNGLILLTRSVIIDASALADGVILNAHGRNRLFHGGSQSTNTLIGLTLTGGYSMQGGGAILNDSILTLNACTLTGNIANEGGAIFQFEPVMLNNCTIVSNYARFGGAIENDGFRGALTLNNCTLAHNVSTNEGGAIFNFFTTLLNNCTVVSNTATSGGGIINEGALFLTNCIVAGNSAPSNPSTAQIAGSIDGFGGSNITSGDPMLAALGNYGGPTQSMPPLPGSPAIDPAGGHTNSVFATDQRGLPRVVNGLVDVGAVEVQSLAVAPIQITGAAMLGDGTFQLSFSNLAGASFQVLATTNITLPVSHWPTIGPAIEMPPNSGWFQFTDLHATNHIERYYRVNSP